RGKSHAEAHANPSGGRDQCCASFPQGPRGLAPCLCLASGPYARGAHPPTQGSGARTTRGRAATYDVSFAAFAWTWFGHSPAVGNVPFWTEPNHIFNPVLERGAR